MFCCTNSLRSFTMYLKVFLPFAHLDDSWQFHVWLQPSSRNHSKSFMFCKATDRDNQSDWKIKGKIAVDSGCFQKSMDATITIQDVWNKLIWTQGFHVDTWHEIDFARSSPQALKITREQFVELGLRHQFVSSKNPCLFRDWDEAELFLSYPHPHSTWKIPKQYFSMKETCSWYMQKWSSEISQAPTFPRDLHVPPISRERLDFPQRKAVGGMAQNILVKEGWKPTVVVEGSWYRGDRGRWVLRDFRSQRRRQRVKETWRSQWRDCNPAPPGMYETM